MAIRGYHQYRGKGRNGRKTLLVALLLLILLGACTFLFLQRFVVYDSDGSAHLELPFGRHQQEDVPGKIPDDEIDIQREEIPAPQPEPEPEPLVLQPLHAWELPSNCLNSNPSAALRERDAVVVNVKQLDGSITFSTGINLPKNVKKGSKATLDHLQTITSSSCYTVARICALCDSTYPAGKTSAAYQTSSGSLWRDNYGRTWLDPTSEEAAEYLCALAKECAQLGFDEILLDQFRFPIEGDLNQSSLPAGTKRPDAIAALVEKIREAVGPQVAVSILLPASLDSDSAFKASGLTPKVLTERFDRIYVPQGSDAYAWLNGTLAKSYDRTTRLVLTGYSTVKGSYMIVQ